MYFVRENQVLIGKSKGETIRIEPWGTNAVRVRATLDHTFPEENWGLMPVTAKAVQISIEEKKASLQNGKLKAEIDDYGHLCFYRDDELVLDEYYRFHGDRSRHAPALKLSAREFVPHLGGDYALTARFESRDGEKFFGMGQYQQPQLNLKGCTLELAQRNSQISIPFALSSLGYGFLWNNPAIGQATFAENITTWHAESTKALDYWITVDDTPKQILANYTEVTGRAPEMPDNVLGLWQCKLRYRTQDELLEVAREYHRRGIPLDVIVIDFFHWIYQGDWSFDPKYWPDPKAMMEELRSMGTRCMVSIWPTVDKRSSNYKEMNDRGLLIRTERGSNQTLDCFGDTVFYDATNPEAREYLWKCCKENYGQYGIDMFWLDEAEPEYMNYQFDSYRTYLGPNVQVGNLYPRLHAKAFYDGQKAEGQKDIINLLRCAWVGSQQYGALVWSGDIVSDFKSLRDQFAAGLNIGIAGIPWWTTDTGGFNGSIEDEHFLELLIRWFEYSTFCPVLRMHGDRGPHNIPLLDPEGTCGGGICHTGQPNELWSYGEDAYAIMKKYLDIRLKMKDYLKALAKEAEENGSPMLRTMFYEFPEDPKCWEVKEQYMFGPKLLVAPVLYQGVTSREVYLPQGTWKNIHTGETLSGGQTITVSAPLEIIPVFERL